MNANVISLAKDRAGEEIDAIISSESTYRKLSKSNKARLKALCKFIAMPDSGKAVHVRAIKLNMVTGEEGRPNGVHPVY